MQAIKSLVGDSFTRRVLINRPRKDVTGRYPLLLATIGESPHRIGIP